MREAGFGREQSSPHVILTRLRQRHVTRVCGSRRLMLREGYRFVFSYADIVVGEMRIAIAAADCASRS